MSERQLREILESVAAGDLSVDEGFEALGRFDGEQSVPDGDPRLRRVVVEGRFLNVELTVDDTINDAVAEPGGGWSWRRVADTLYVDGLAFLHGPDERTNDDRGREVAARLVEDRGDCVFRLRVPTPVRLEGDILVGRIVTRGVHGFHGRLRADYGNLG